MGGSGSFKIVRMLAFMIHEKCLSHRPMSVGWSVGWLVILYTPKPIHILKAHDTQKDKDNNKDKDRFRLTERHNMRYILGKGMTHGF